MKKVAKNNYKLCLMAQAFAIIFLIGAGVAIGGDMRMLDKPQIMQSPTPAVLDRLKPLCPDLAAAKPAFAHIETTDVDAWRVKLTGTATNIGYEDVPCKGNLKLFLGNQLLAEKGFGVVSKGGVVIVEHVQEFNKNASYPSQELVARIYYDLSCNPVYAAGNTSAKTPDCNLSNNEQTVSLQDLWTAMAQYKYTPSIMGKWWISLARQGGDITFSGNNQSGNIVIPTGWEQSAPGTKCSPYQVSGLNVTWTCTSPVYVAGVKQANQSIDTYNGTFASKNVINGKVQIRAVDPAGNQVGTPYEVGWAATRK